MRPIVHYVRWLFASDRNPYISKLAVWRCRTDLWRAERRRPA